MKEQIINLETAKLAKEKGFDLKVIKHYKGDELIYNGSLYNFNNPEEQSQWNIELNSAPTQSLLQKWLREKTIDKYTKQISTELYHLSKQFEANGDANAHVNARCEINKKYGKFWRERLNMKKIYNSPNPFGKMSYY